MSLDPALAETSPLRIFRLDEIRGQVEVFLSKRPRRGNEPGFVLLPGDHASKVQARGQRFLEFEEPVRQVDGTILVGVDQDENEVRVAGPLSRLELLSRQENRLAESILADEHASGFRL